MSKFKLIFSNVKFQISIVIFYFLAFLLDEFLDVGATSCCWWDFLTLLGLLDLAGWTS